MNRLLLGLLALLALTGPAFAQTSVTPYVGNGNTSTGQIITAPLGTCATCVQLPITGTVTTGAQTPTPSTNFSGTIATGGTFQTVLTANTTTRKGCLVENPTTATEPLYVYASTGGSPSTSNAFSLAPGSAFSCTSAGGVVISDAIQVTAASNGHGFVGASQ